MRMPLLPALLLLLVSSAQAQFAGGSGIREDPYLIATVDHLQAILYYPGKHFLQIADIDAEPTAEWNDGKGFIPIGTFTATHPDPFTGSYDGDGFVISGLSIHREDEDYVGLFRYTLGAAIHHLHLNDLRVSGYNRVGGLAGLSQESQISNTSVTGRVRGNDWVGGLVGINGRQGLIECSSSLIDVSGNHRIGGLAGENFQGDISGSYAGGEVSGDELVGGLAGRNLGQIWESNASGDVFSGHYAGGLVGENEQGTIRFCLSKGNVLGKGNAVGGLVGRNSGEILRSQAWGRVDGVNTVGGLVGRNLGKIIESRSMGEVTGSESAVGGLIGSNGLGYILDSCASGTVSGAFAVGGLVGLNGQEIRNSYALGMVTGTRDVGGLVGVNSNEGFIAAAFATGKTEGDQKAGGLIGLNEAEMESCYWDLMTTRQTNGTGAGTVEGGHGLQTSEMTGVSAYKKMSGFDFDHTWLLTKAYPALHWEDVEALELPSSSEDEAHIRKLKLEQNYPNPFNPSTQIRFALPETAHVHLTVYNLLGQQVATLVNETRSAGWHDVTFDASELSSSVFIYRLEAGEYVETRSMMFLK